VSDRPSMKGMKRQKPSDDDDDDDDVILVSSPRCSDDSSVIVVQAALYGRADRETCGEGRPPSQLADTQCSQGGSAEVLKTRYRTGRGATRFLNVDPRGNESQNQVTQTTQNNNGSLKGFVVLRRTINY